MTELHKKAVAARQRKRGAAALIDLARFAATMLTEGTPVKMPNGSRVRARQQFRKPRKTGFNFNPRPKLAAALRAKYMQPLIPWTMYAVDLPISAENDYGLVSTETMEAYAAHFEVGGPWINCKVSYGTIAPALPSDPLYRSRKSPSFIALIERAVLRHKYEMRAYWSLGPSYRLRAEVFVLI